MEKNIAWVLSTQQGPLGANLHGSIYNIHSISSHLEESYTHHWGNENSVGELEESGTGAERWRSQSPPLEISQHRRVSFGSTVYSCSVVVRPWPATGDWVTSLLGFQAWGNCQENLFLLWSLFKSQITFSPVSSFLFAIFMLACYYVQ